MLKLKNYFAALFVILAFLVVGCASIVSKSSYPVAINSSPDQADFTIVNKHGEVIHSGKTPATVTLKSGCGYFSGEEYHVTFKKDGYATNTTTISSSLDGWYIGNIVFGGLIGILIVDPATGAMWKLPPSVSASMYEDDAASNNPEKSLYIISYNNIPDSEKANLIRIDQ